MPVKRLRAGGVSKDNPGFEDAPQAAFSTHSLETVSRAENRVRLTLGPGGRVVIPSALRDAMEIQEGDAILAWVDGGELHMLSPKVGARQAQAMIDVLIPGNVSLAGDLIRDRRREGSAGD